MNKNIIETIMGGVVLLVAVSFIYIAYKSGNIAAPSNGYVLSAKFDQVDGLGMGSDVRISGLKIGTVTDQKVDPETYQAVVTFAINSDIKLPKDSTAMITSEGLLGGKYLSLVPGADDAMLKNGDVIQFTQSSVNLEQLLGKFAFGSVDKDESKSKAAPKNAAPAAEGTGDASAF